jgi:hypothetical protein
MPGEVSERVDFFLSRRGSVAAVAREVENVLTAADYKVFVQDYDIPLGASFVDAMHEAVKNARDLIILFTKDYEQSPYTRKEFTSFEAERLRDERDVRSSSCAATTRRFGAFWPTQYIRISSASPSQGSADAAFLRRRSAARRLSGRSADAAGLLSASRRALRVSPAGRRSSTSSTPF